MDPYKLLEKYYKTNSELYYLLKTHSESVKNKALKIAQNVPELNPDFNFISEAALLHDIGIYLVNAPQIHCHGKQRYLRHGILGAKILNAEGFPKHAKVCACHIGVGITKQEIIQKNLPLPKKDFLPETTEEEIICLADAFFGKSQKDISKSRSYKVARKKMQEISEFHAQKFDEFCKKYKLI